MWDSLVRLPRDTPEKLAFMLDSLVRVSQQQRWKNQKHNSFFVCHCLGAWEPGAGGQDMEDVGDTSEGQTADT